MENTSSVRGPFDQSAYRHADIKTRFYRHFQDEVTELQEQVNKLENNILAGGERQEAIDHCLAGISRLTNEVSDVASSIPAYDQRTYAQENLDAARTKFAPKSRFKFKTTNKNNSAISLSDAAELAAQQRLNPPVLTTGGSSSNESSVATTPFHLRSPPGEADVVGSLPSFAKNYNDEMTSQAIGSIRKPSFSQATNVNISGHKDLHIILPSSASRATSSGSLTKLSGCIVDMSAPTSEGAPFAGLALKSITSSLIIAGHVAGPAHITAVEDSIIVVASRQVRMHDCKNTDVYLHCASRPIIEGCKNVRFSPIPACHTAVLEKAIRNQWDQVDDFKWLKAEPSPNWSIIPEGHRLQEDIWTTVVTGGPGVGLDDILKKVGIVKR
ncbi:hypothetical protein OIDMADRAFT_123615 [Oidiodendron maius Zn]|uniref:C-CAP/cofactor C-like domain-containing protein n=1 Tax=Oidiodendron maius (strain Zn) TaxID=913774 RepID=A0A0C3HCC4_OIDMZ|nr:hypothetical protein OIDMADRAFT_123615 [Oidiodendron maius Zn]